MKEVGKLYKIYQGFFVDELPEEESKARKEICAKCPFNSVNADKLSLMDSIRNNFTAPFCTLCKCQIKEKTESPLEECALYMIGEDKKWFKIKIETMEKETLNLIQVGDIKYDIQLVNDYFVVDFGKVSSSNPAEIELLFETKQGLKLNYESIHVTCGCTASKVEVINDTSIKVKLKVNIKEVGYGAGMKSVELKYNNSVQKIKLKFYRTA